MHHKIALSFWSGAWGQVPIRHSKSSEQFPMLVATSTPKDENLRFLECSEPSEHSKKLFSCQC
jgi:hypothetical protein